MNKYKVEGYRNNDPEDKFKTTIVANSEDSVKEKLSYVGYHINDVKLIKENYSSGRRFEERTIKITLNTNADLNNDTEDTEIILTRIHDAIKKELDDMEIDYADLSISLK